MPYRVKHLIEYGALRAVVALLSRLPYRGAVGVGTGLAWLAHWVFCYRAETARQRIRLVFGSRFSDAEVRGIAWRAWRNFIWSMVDLVQLPHMTLEWCRRHVVDFDQFEARARACLPPGQGAVVSTPHMGTSELGGVSLQMLGVPMFFFAGRQKNPLVNAYLHQLRGSTGVASIRKGTPDIRDVVRRLRHGEVLGIMPDLRFRTPGVSVPFLGGLANVPPGMALFAIMGKCPIVPGIALRLSASQHSLRLLDPIVADPALDKEENIRRMTSKALELVDQEIRAHPDQWFWYNKRWILDPIEESDAPAT